MEIIDFHVHIYPDKIAEKASISTGNFYNLTMYNPISTVSNLITEGEKAGVCTYLVHSVASVPKQIASINNFISDQCTLHNKFIGFGTLHKDMENPEEEINRIIALGLNGIKIHPDIQQFNADDEKMFKIYDIIRGKLPLLIHSGDYRFDFSHPHRIKNILANFPDLTVIAAHLGGWSLWDLALEYLLGTNCYVDTSSSTHFLGKIRTREIIKAYGAEKVLFGTDYPMWKVQNEIDFINSLNLSNEELTLIYNANAKKILNLS